MIWHPSENPRTTSGFIVDGDDRRSLLEVRMEDMETSFRTIMDALVKLTNESQWVPLNWVYSWSSSPEPKYFRNNSSKISSSYKIFILVFNFVNMNSQFYEQGLFLYIWCVKLWNMPKIDYSSSSLKPIICFPMTYKYTL